MSTVTTTELSFVPSSEASTEQQVWAAAHLAELPTRIIFKADPVEIGESPDGKTMRRAFRIVADPEVQAEFRLYLNSGASEIDLAQAKRTIERAKKGIFNTDVWKRRKRLKNWILNAFWEQKPEDSHHRELRECFTRGCIKQFHVYVGGEIDDAHEAEELTNADRTYSVYAFNHEDEERWHAVVDLDSDFPNGVEGLKALRDAANDLAWMHAECEKWNAAEVTV